MATKVKRQQQTLTADTDPQVYDYGRFSAKRQAKGGSKRRQQGDDESENRARKYAAKVGLPFNESLRMFDEGLSAFHGVNVSKGALGKFLSAIDTGTIAPGSILWVESIDRLTRQNAMAGLKMILFGIIEKGVSIYVDDLHELYSTDNADESIGELYGEIRRAHRESKRKSELSAANWEQRRKDVRANGGILDMRIPLWIEVVGRVVKNQRVIEQGKFVLRAGAKKSLTMLLQRKELTPKVGCGTLARELNEKAPWAPPGGWQEDFVWRTLSNRALIGEKQPGRLIGGQLGERVPEGDVIPDYYPAAVDKGLFLRVQQLLAKVNAGKANNGRNDKAANVLQGLCVCPYCGGSFNYHDDTVRQCLHCVTRRRTKKQDCNAPTVPYKACVDAVLEHCQRLRIDQLLPAKSQQQKLIRATNTTISTLSAELEDIKEQVTNFEDQIGRTKDAKRRDSYEAKIVALEAEQADKEKALGAARQELQQLTRAQTSFEDWQKNIEALRKSLDSRDMRQRLNGHLMEFIDKIEVYSRGYPDPLEKCYNADIHTDDFEDWLRATEDDGGYSIRHPGKFVPWAIGQRRTRAGRFLRIHYQMSEGVKQRRREMWGSDWKPYFDIPLAGSIAGDTNIVALWEQFKTSKKRA